MPAYDICPVCGKSFLECPHTVSEATKKIRNLELWGQFHMWFRKAIKPYEKRIEELEKKVKEL